MHIFHDVGPDDCMQVGLHEIKHQIDIFIIFCLEDVEQRYDIWVAVELLQEYHLGYYCLYLAVCSLRISRILKGIEYLLQCHDLLCLLIHRLPNHTVGPFAQLL
jgi:hypothetical protein